MLMSNRRGPGPYRLHPADAVFHWALQNPELPAVIEPDMVITYGALAEAIDAIGERVLQFGLDRTEPVAVVINRSAKHLAACLALLHSGITTISCNRRNLQHLNANNVKCAICNLDGEILPGGKVIRFSDAWLQRQHKSVPTLNPTRQHHAAETDLIFFTSGTTGVPKKVVLPSGVFEERVNWLPIAGEASFSRTLVLPGIDSSFGFVRTAMILYAGRTACFAGNAEAQLQMISTFGVEMISGSPQQIVAILDTIDNGAQYELYSLKEVRIGGGFASQDLVARVKSKLCRNVIAEYGATEAGQIAIANYDALVDVPFAVGFPLPGVTVEIVDENRSPLPTGEEGLVRCRSDYVRKVFEANRPEGGVGRAVGDELWWYPGDLGRLTESGLLCIGGRADDVINCGGVKMSGEVIDNAVRKFPGIKDAGACSVRGTSGIEEVWIGIVSELEIDKAALIQSLNSSIGFRIGVSEVIVLDQIPRNSLGKLQRHKLKEILAELK